MDHEVRAMRDAAPARRAAHRTIELALALGLALGIGGAPSPAGAADEVAIHGFLSQGFMHTRDYDYLAESADGTFQFSEIGLNCSSVVGDDLRVGIQLFARDLGTLGNNRVELDWAYGDYSWDDALGLRAGRIRLPYGLYNETRDIDALRTAVLMPQGVYDQRFRDILVAITGASFYGTTPWTSAGSLEYQAFWGMANMSTDNSVAQLLNSTGVSTVTGFESRHSGGLGLVWSAPVSGLRIGSTFNHFAWSYDGRLSPEMYALLSPLGAAEVQAVSSENSRVITSSVEYQRGPVTLVAEHTFWGGRLENPFIGLTLNREAWYGLASYRFTDWLELGGYYSVLYQDRDDREGRNLPLAHMGYQKDLTTSARFDVNDFFLIKAELHFIHGTASLLQTDNFAEGGERWTLFTGKTSFVF